MLENKTKKDGRVGDEKELDYLVVLKALNEIKFPVGKALLVDFLIGNIKNPSIKKNDMFECYNFRKLRYYSEGEIKSMIDNLISNSMIDVRGYPGNRFAQVLEINYNGREELMEPSLHKKKMAIARGNTIITDEEREIFRELEPFLSGYNDEQKKAIVSGKKNILCIAGAGSGKTSVLTKRIEFLVRYKSIPPSKILAITFTRKARREMERKLAKLGIAGVNVETFNSFSEGILKKYASIVYSRPTRVISYPEKIFLMSMAIGEIGLKMEEVTGKYFSENQKKNKDAHKLSNIFMNDCFSVLEYFKSKNQKIYDFSKDVDEEDVENARTIFQTVQNIDNRMKLAGLRDYVDQILDTIKFFKEHAESIPEFEHVLIDEYQDVNAMQIELIDLIRKNNIFVVGDPRQSIFGWRGSDIKYILKFREKMKDCEEIHLVKNYRSEKRIVEFMNHAVRDMKVPDLEYVKESHSKISLSDFGSEEEEFDFILNEILMLKKMVGGEDIFVLSRTNRMLNELSNKLKANNIAHLVSTDEIKKPVLGSGGEVTLATIHAIKGLEARFVFVMGCNELNFPCKASDHPVIEIVKMGMAEYDKEEEERRLFYVAISRAKERLYLSYSGKKPTYFINDAMKKMIEA